VVRLHKAMYGVCQAPRVWNTKLEEGSICTKQCRAFVGPLGRGTQSLTVALPSSVFVRCSSKHVVYMRREGPDRF
jgi:hypothetical protein